MAQRVVDQIAHQGLEQCLVAHHEPAVTCIERHGRSFSHCRRRAVGQHPLRDCTQFARRCSCDAPRLIGACQLQQLDDEARHAVAGLDAVVQRRIAYGRILGRERDFRLRTQCCDRRAQFVRRMRGKPAFRIERVTDSQQEFLEAFGETRQLDRHGVGGHWPQVIGAAPGKFIGESSQRAERATHDPPDDEAEHREGHELRDEGPERNAAGDPFTIRVILRDVHDDATLGVGSGVHAPADRIQFGLAEAGRQAGKRRRWRVDRPEDQLATGFAHLESDLAAIVRNRVRVVIELDLLELVTRLRNQQASGLGQMGIEQGIDAPVRIAIRQRG